MDHLTKEGRSELMRKVGSKWTGPERRLYRALCDLGLDPRTHDQQLPGKPDFVFDEQRSVATLEVLRRPLAVLVEGCYWHGCPRHYKRPKTNKKFWDNKISANVARDARNRRALSKMGIRFMRIWEHDLGGEKPAERMAKKVERRLCAKS